MTDPTEFLVEAAPIFAALGDRTRLWIVRQLCAAPQSIVRLTDASQISRQAITKHVHALERAGLVRRRDGRERLWEIEPRRFAAVGDALGRISGLREL